MPQRTSWPGVAGLVFLVGGLALLWWSGSSRRASSAAQLALVSADSEELVRLATSATIEPDAPAESGRVPSSERSGAARARAILLHVLDAETRRELSDVSVVHDPHAGVALSTPRRFHPGPHGDEHVWASAAAAPLTIPLGPGPGTQYWIGAAGYGWTGLGLSPDAVGERTVELRPCGTLDVGVLAVPAGDEAKLSILALDDEPALVMEHRVGGDVRLLLSGWHPGSYRCQLRVGPGGSERVVADEPVSVRAGQCTLTTLVFPELDEAGPPASLEGVLIFPEREREFETLVGELSVRLLPESPSLAQLARSNAALVRESKDMQRTTLGPGVRLWRFDDVPPGEYAVLVSPIGLTRSVHVDPGDSATVELEVPPLAYSRVRWVRERGRRGEPLAGLTARLAGSDGAGMLEPEIPARFDEPDGSYLLASVPGRLRLLGTEAGLTPRSEEVEAAPGWNDFELLLGTSVQLALTLRLDGRPHAVDPRFWFDVEVSPIATDHVLVSRQVKGRALERASEDCGATFAFSGDGTYRFTFPALDGFEPIPPRVLSTGEASPAAIELVRRP